MVSATLAVPSLMLAMAPYNWSWWSGSPYSAYVTWPPVKGVYIQNLNVGSRYGSAMFVDDQTGCAFIFGGVTYGKENSYDPEVKDYGLTNDMWRLDFSRDATTAWTWVHGSDQFDHIGSYTTIGDTNQNVFPGARAYFMHFYDGDLRKFYIFNGKGYANSEINGNTGDHWTYSVDTNSFTWIGGTLELNLRVRFVLLEESSSTSIGGLSTSAFAYNSNSKLFFIYGGANSGQNLRSALWRYRVSNNLFTVLTNSGSLSTSSIKTNGTLHPGNKPGARDGASMIITDQGKVYMFGGFGQIPVKGSETIVFDDCAETWMFDYEQNMWAFVAGSPYAFDDGNYVRGSLYQYPSRRSYSTLIYDPSTNRVLLQGGEKYDQSMNQVLCSDEWLLSVENHTWALISGESCSISHPVYGQYRVPSSQNSPGSRSQAAPVSQNGSAYLFGGSYVADLWRVDFAMPASSIVVISTTASILTTSTTSLTTSTTTSTSSTASSTTYTASTPSTTPTSSSYSSTSTTSTSSTTSSISTTSSTPTTPTEDTTVMTTSTWSTSTSTYMSTFTTISESSSVGLDLSTTQDLPSATTGLDSSATPAVSQSSTLLSTYFWSTSLNARSTGTSSEAVVNPNTLSPSTVLDPSLVISAAVGIAGFALMVLLLFSFWFFKYRKRKGYLKTPMLPLSSTGRLYSGNSAPSLASSITQATLTLVTLTQDVLSIPAYLEVPESSFRITSKLSQGGGGEIFLADALDDKTRKFGKLLVVKRIRSYHEEQDLTPKQVKLFEQELSVMALLRGYKNISKLVGYCRAGSHSILMKYYPMGSLDKFLQNQKNVMTGSVIIHFVTDIACGIKSLHQNELSHSDIKTANILLDVDEDGFVFCVLTDFGITQILSLEYVVDGFNVTNIRGLSCAYASPETFERLKSRSLINDSALSFKAGDIYSFGSVIYEIISRRYPWSLK